MEIKNVIIAKQQFIEKLIKELILENELRKIKQSKPLNICFLISTIIQQIDRCNEFMDIIKTYEYELGSYYETSDYNTIGIIKILILKPKEERENNIYEDSYYNYYYEIEFKLDNTSCFVYSYCDCTPEMDGYNYEYKCCGINCDWSAPSFSIIKKQNIYCSTWSGKQKDYWNYEKKFNNIFKL